MAGTRPNLATVLDCEYNKHQVDRTALLGKGAGMADQFYGIYAGKVMSSRDPMNRGRVQVFVPSVGGGSTWAAACQPYKSSAAPPPVGTQVWVMFEEGDVNYPVWMGCATDGW